MRRPSRIELLRPDSIARPDSLARPASVERAASLALAASHALPASLALPTTLALAALLALSACTSVAELSARDRDSAQREIRSHLALDEDAPAGDAELDAFVAERLGDGLSDADAVAIALALNPGLRVSLARLGIASADVVAAQRLPNPVLSANAKFFTSGTEIELGLVQPFLALLSRSANVAAADALRDHELAIVTREGVHLAFEARRGFAELVAFQRLSETESANLELARESHGLVSSLHAAGNLDDVQLARADAELSAAELRVIEARSAVDGAREQIQRLLGLRGDTIEWSIAEAPQAPAGEQQPQAPAGEQLPQAPAAAQQTQAPAAGPQTDLPPPDEIERSALEASLDLRAQRGRVEWAARRADVELRSAMLPEARAGVVAKQETGGAWGIGPGLELSLPVFDRGVARRSRSEAELELELETYRAVEIEVRSGARLFVGRLRAAQARDRALDEIHLPALARVVTEELRRYNAMQIGVFDVLAARARELDGRLDAIEAELEAEQARLDLGELLAGSLAQERLDRAGTGLDRGARDDRQGTRSKEHGQ